ncbi:hypothetical protein L1987_30202 [Smallanthus sonchifolius]|uniref:Uncharacterized protein n=1 Tax=Smallanthus sonchifolius TaxID=185202 RepID=A0ACB9I4T6_9ASTR|nr:hypothetical protein L1987_30202 [Smallanthus sonchifolius]
MQKANHSLHFYMRSRIHRCCKLLFTDPVDTTTIKRLRFEFHRNPMLIDNNATMSITNNPVKHSKTKHIEIRYHFIRDCAQKRLIELVKVHTDDNFADLFTKAFDRTSLHK